jgi:hypothetical protein
MVGHSGLSASEMMSDVHPCAGDHNIGLQYLKEKEISKDSFIRSDPELFEFIFRLPSLWWSS